MQRRFLLSFLFLLLSRPAWAQFHGFYVDEPSYQPGENIAIHASSPETVTAIFRLVRHDGNWTEVARTEEVQVAPQTTSVGSFVELDGAGDLLGGRTALTLEGWFYPTLVGGDTVVIAGQGGLGAGSAGILLLEDGRPAGYVGDSLAFDASRMAVAPDVLSIDAWHHLALRYDANAGSIALFVDGQEVASASGTGAVANNSQPFRIGARAEAPGDLTGIADGRFDSWALWPRALSSSEVAARRQAGIAQPDPQPDPADVDLYLGFEDSYGQVIDSSHDSHPVRIINHGTPRVPGVHPQSMALRLNHDQIVDAGWPKTASLPIPEGMASGLYSIQVLLGPDYQDLRVTELTRSFAIRPRAPTPGVRVAVVLPTDTWLAYNDWPGDWRHRGPIAGLTSRRRHPQSNEIRHGGNNSAYGFMGDGVSKGYFQGWRRPNSLSSVIGSGPGKTGNKGPQSLFLAQWLESVDIAFDVYTDLDLTLGRFPATGDYRVLIPHGHHEYWSQEMLDTVQEFQAGGGSLVSIAGNVLVWRTSHGPGRIMEIRKVDDYTIDERNAMDGKMAGFWPVIAACHRGGYLQSTITGSVMHFTAWASPASCGTECFGRWEVKNSDHWLWGGSVSDGEHLGQSPVSGLWTVGHEADTYVPGLIPPGLMADTTPVVLAEGAAFGEPEHMKIRFAYPGPTPPPPPTCEEIRNPPANPIPERPVASSDTRAGSVVLFRHQGGGYVLSIGAVGAPWALSSDPKFAGMIERAIHCFALGQGCPADSEGNNDAGVSPDSGSSSSGDSDGCSLSSANAFSAGAGFLLWISIAAFLGTRRLRRRGTTANLR